MWRDKTFFWKFRWKDIAEKKIVKLLGEYSNMSLFSRGRKMIFLSIGRATQGLPNMFLKLGVAQLLPLELKMMEHHQPLRRTVNCKAVRP